MKKFLIVLVCLITCLFVNFSFAYTKGDVIDALNKTYEVNGEKVKLPSSLKNKALNYLNGKEVTEAQCDELMKVIDKGVDFASTLDTTDPSKLSASELKTALGIVKEATSILDMDIKVNETLDKIVATDKETGKIVEEVDNTNSFFKKTGGERNTLVWIGIAFAGLVLLIVLYVVLVKVVKFAYIDFICNTVLLLYIICGMPFIAFGHYLEFLELLEPVLSSKNGDGYIDIVDTVINEVNKDNTKENNQSGNKVNPDKDNSGSNKTVNEEDEVVSIKYPVLGEMYAKLNISSCDINLPVYYGDNEKILEVGVGHYSGSHFPGEGKGILYTTHNTSDKLYNLKDIKNGDKVELTTTFGTFEYVVTKSEVIQETDERKAKIESDKELLMIYTCYPFGADKYTDKRFMVYCERSDA